MGKGNKVVVCGMKGVGKTRILERLVFGKKSDPQPTIEDIYVALVDTERSTKERMYLYDTAGVLPPNSIPKHYMAFADAYVLVYDNRQPDSLTALTHLHKDIEKNREKKETVIIVLGNITGPPNPELQENTVSKASNWCTRERLRHFQVNADERSSLYEPFTHLSTRLNPAPTKSSFPQLPALTKLTQKGIIRTDSS